MDITLLYKLVAVQLESLNRPSTFDWGEVIYSRHGTRKVQLNKNIGASLDRGITRPSLAKAYIITDVMPTTVCD